MHNIDFAQLEDTYKQILALSFGVPPRLLDDVGPSPMVEIARTASILYSAQRYNTEWQKWMNAIMEAQLSYFEGAFIEIPIQIPWRPTSRDSIIASVIIIVFMILILVLIRLNV